MATSNTIAKGLAVWCVEFTSAVLMIMFNKALMTGSLDFRYPTTLTAAHFAWTAAGSSVINSCTQSESGAKLEVLPPWFVIGGFVVLSSMAIILSNASLLVNSVAFYQIMKLATLPFVAIVEWSAGTKTFAWWHVLFYAAILAGVGMTIVGDVVATFGGTIIASMSVMSAGLHQANYDLSPSKLLAMVSPFKALLLFTIGPLLDGFWFGGWLGNYVWTLSAAFLILLTCLLAISLNISQYSAINLLGAGQLRVGPTDFCPQDPHLTATAPRPGTYQALSQLKTAAVVVLGSLYFQGRVDPRQLAGTVITISAVAGLTTYERRLRSAAEKVLPVVQLAEHKADAVEAESLLSPSKSPEAPNK
eukprot:scaffold27.g6000.t1